MNTKTDFNFTYAPGITPEQIIGFEMAGEFWSQYLTDSVGINIHIEMTNSLPENVIGGAIPAINSNVEYADYRQNLKQDINSRVDRLINHNQQDETDKFTAYFSSQYEEDGYKVDNNEYMQMTRANAKALDLLDGDANGLDGYIVMRDLSGVGDGQLNNLSWSYNYQGEAVANNSIDFLSVAIHEVGHVLGFISGVDQANWLTELDNLNEDNEDDYYSDLVGNVNNATPLDMMRFSQASYESSGEDENWIDMSLGGNPYMSFTGSGGNAVAYFSTGRDTNLGDGYQASHWRQKDNPLSIMAPALAKGQKREITTLDLQAFDGIGWDVRYDTSLNIPALYSRAAAAVNSAWIGDRQNDVDEILDGEAYEGRRTRSATTIHKMSIDGYFSTYSQPEAAVADLGNQMMTIDSWVVTPNNDQQDTNSWQAEAETKADSSHELTVGQVTANYLEIDHHQVESDLLQQIKDGLNTSLGFELATAAV